MISELFFMNGFGIYVWPAYLLCALVLAINFIQPLRDFARLKKQLRKSLKKPNA